MKDLRPPGRRLPAPPAPSPDQLSPRDLQILLTVARFRVMSGAMLRELYWPQGSPETRARLARRGLARLAKLELLTPLARRVGGVRSGSAGLSFALGPSAQRLLAAGSPPRRVRRPHTPGERHLAHTLAVAQLYVDLAVLARSQSSRMELLAFDPEPDCWATYPGPYGARQVLKPDAYVKLGIGEYLFSWLIEQDMATEAQVTIAAKAARYVDCWRTGTLQAERGVFPRTAWIAPDKARGEIIQGALRRLPVEARKLFVVTTAADAAAFLAGGGSS
ncbi:MAG TPA: replication-relaxation family protein [Solirubrobacteraceae bacterium]|nr:replication-relaxation family protein [Solirubrobacteraceae bacterium]